MNHKIRKSLPDLDQWVVAERAAGRRIGFTCGAFDLLHAGHVQYLQQARELCDSLLVAVNTDESVRRYKSPLRPINPLEFRMETLAALECVSAVTCMDDDRPIRLIERWQPDLYIKGGDYAPQQLRSSPAVAAYGGQTIVIPMKHAVSTSALIERIQALGTHAFPAKAGSAGKRVLFLDRDGTIIDNVPFLREPDRVRVREGVIEALKPLVDRGLRLVIITNQQGIGLGYFGMDEFIAVNQRMLREFGARGVSIERIYYCPHSESAGCDCRKPRPGMLLRACQELGVDPRECFFIGDTEADEEAGRRAQILTWRVGQRDGDFQAAASQILTSISGAGEQP